MTELLRVASARRGFGMDTLILAAWSALTFWNAWFLGRSLLRRSLGVLETTGFEPPALFGLVLRLLCLFVIDILMYVRFAWAPQVSQYHQRADTTEGRTDATEGEKVRAKDLEVLVAELRRENAELRLKLYA
ncbi:hypothetical protein CcaverHIS002_0401920 [Cutaneotrichosporon cavernicola]|uniref:Uncharacterized protein n=1 Tax=Cutaneotrichosporon cavernicola TaxID=279322 RepID=A0AA48QVJ2_9TREE|nr:uncharacterized protein CcaverHIS019_0401880 [Cutaneotrichosporon cavernicola]BEI83588.1 hypothetical protein CcaverHIS002_0401920 [Cutaneotrichosporon cavernicola]BEI91368.1 hypothetical protein CcaverHIS019_0401880 [Cutaneotrichosporon cavernicola]BEI99141.1 hypothetical protein CcaverHIS631_0401840 [Cutaneotrichosporon cavernicola]BEJ06916.1 hypothetical protein CcaverHIS641_0401850 [Cutaneotrichosporon cavernicola]